MCVKGTVRKTAWAAAVAAAVGAGLVSPGTAYANSPAVHTTDRNLAGKAYFLSTPTPEMIQVYDMNRSDKYAVVASLWARQDDGSWVRRMRARATGQNVVDTAEHNIDEGRDVELIVCLEEGDGSQIYCNSWEGEA